MPPDPPVAISAVWDGGLRECRITFDMSIQPPGIPWDLANWVLTHDGGTKNPLGISVSGAVVTLVFTGSTGVTQIAYDPPPFDVVAEPPNGLPAAAFTMPL